MTATEKIIDIESFIDSYLHTAAWVFCEPDENSEFSEEGRQIAKQDCIKFMDLVLETFGNEKGLELLKTGGNDLPYLAAHDFFLTRNGHGAGFWDKPEKYGQKEADQLTEICEKIGGSDVYHTDGTDSPLTFD